MIPNVVPVAECDNYIRQYRTWLSRYGENCPHWNKSIIQQYRVGHAEPTWKTRLWTKPIFASIWKTDKLLSSVDGVAIGEPPELGKRNLKLDIKYSVNVVSQCLQSFILIHDQGHGGFKQ